MLNHPFGVLKWYHREMTFVFSLLYDGDIEPIIIICYYITLNITGHLTRSLNLVWSQGLHTDFLQSTFYLALLTNQQTAQQHQDTSQWKQFPRAPVPHVHGPSLHNTLFDLALLVLLVRGLRIIPDQALIVQSVYWVPTFGKHCTHI